jgi:hypothetical protein
MKKINRNGLMLFLNNNPIPKINEYPNIEETIINLEDENFNLTPLEKSIIEQYYIYELHLPPPPSTDPYIQRLIDFSRFYCYRSFNS